MKQYFAVGTYTESILFGTGEVFEGKGKGKGISICEMEDGVIKVREEIAVRNPSFLTYRFENNTVEPEEDYTFSVKPGNGPRSGVFGHGLKDFYLIQEISSKVTHYEYSAGAVRERETVSTLPDACQEQNICPDLHRTPDGIYLYASNRGHDSLACYRLDESGCMQFVRRQPCGGRTPRNFAIDPMGEFLLVGNQDSDNITVFSVQKDGSLKQVSQIQFASPVCLKFFERTIFG